MKIVLFGLGSIGKKYVVILSKSNKYKLYAFRSEKNRQNTITGLSEIFSWKEFDEIKPEVVFITNPTVLHIKTAIAAAERNCALYIEKPIGRDLTGLNKLIGIVKRKRITTYVAYNLRFHPVTKKLKEWSQKYPPLHARILCSSYLPNWRLTQNYKKNYSSHASMGGGVILDLSHEIDYASYLFGEIKTMDGHFGRRSDLTVDAEDYADIMISAKKCPVNIHINFMSHYKQRIVQIDFKEMSIIGDLINNSLMFYKQEKLTHKRIYKDGINQAYEKELHYFFGNINNPHMMNNLIEASKLFRKIVAFKAINE